MKVKYDDRCKGLVYHDLFSGDVFRFKNDDKKILCMKMYAAGYVTLDSGVRVDEVYINNREPVVYYPDATVVVREQV